MGVNGIDRERRSNEVYVIVDVDVKLSYNSLNGESFDVLDAQLAAIEFEMNQELEGAKVVAFREKEVALAA